jgi:hypothetical protein
MALIKFSSKKKKPADRLISGLIAAKACDSDHDEQATACRLTMAWHPQKGAPTGHMPDEFGRRVITM